MRVAPTHCYSPRGPGQALFTARLPDNDLGSRGTSGRGHFRCWDGDWGSGKDYSVLSAGWAGNPIRGRGCLLVTLANLGWFADL